jgi:hypothetical protein
MVKMKPVLIGLFSALSLLNAPVRAQEKTPAPYFLPYDHYMEEVGSLEIETDAVLGQAHDINTFLGGATQFEYGVRRWWTAELYLDWQHTQHEGGLFTGFRVESRFRPLLEPHKINPVLYVEYEHLNGADKILKEVVGFDGKEDMAVPNSVARREKKHEIETRLILSSEIGEWNLTENVIGEKNLNGNRWEFGYAVGLSRPFAAVAGRRCAFCAEKFAAGVELYGGLGTWGNVTLRGTSQYIAPLFLWALPSNTTIHVSPGWGLTDKSVRILFRFGVSQEVDDIAHKIGKLFRKH